MSDYSQYFLGAPRNVAELELLELSHPSFSQTYRMVRNKTSGVVVNHENGGGTFQYNYLPCKIDRKGSSDDLDSSLDISIGDLGEIVAAEADNVRIANTFAIKPTLKFRVYRSDNLTAPIYGPFQYECVSFAVNYEATTFSATARKLNVTGTGSRYTLIRFPMLRAVS